ncbi:hypothetical protein LTR78_008993 [Recurvomyces mirabilis]|uniref:THO complex subunit 3 n=1 Tax=Recurvomyces mirabilis TaxID=574656 RepID=A0AAE0TPC0_9PEZI|nr:hypothetical protein LTR78_008993 [Recurvomyces mirabilis]KAK5159793.1 hypothetical protein LTS14_001898 [Recurvomyces mirabilis]
MAPALRSRTLKKNDFPTFFKPLKPILFSESLSTKPSPIPPNIRSLSWSPTGTLIATCTGADCRIWNSDRPNVKSSTQLKNAHAKGGVEYGTPGVAGDTVERVAFCPTTEGVLASTGLDGMVRLWDVRAPGAATGVSGKGTALADCKTGGDSAFLTWHPNGQDMLVGRRDDVVHSVDVRRMNGIDGTAQYELQCERKMDRGKHILYAMAFSNSGREVFATTQEGSVRILDYPTMSHLHTLSGHTAAAYTVAQSPTGGYVAIGSGDSTISMWDTSMWLTTHTLSAPSQVTSVRDLSFSFDGSYVVAGAGPDSKDGVPGLNIFHADTGDVVHTIETTHCPSYVAWHPTRYWLAFAGDAGGMKVLGSGTGL